MRPTLATTGGPLIIISSPHARRGEAYETWRKHFGPDGNSSILVAQGASREFNPSLPQRVVDRALERDHAAASAEYLAIWRADIESFLSVEAVSAVVQPGVAELGPLRNEFAYSAFVDPSGGSVNSMTIAIAHMDKSRGVLDCLRERRAPFNPEDVVEEFALLLKRYGLSSVVGDRYAGEWPREAFKRRGVTYLPSAKPKGDIYRDVLPKINAREVALLDNARLINQLVGLERKTARGGRNSIDHAPGGHDDLANAAAGVLVHLTKPRPSTTIAPARGHW